MMIPHLLLLFFYQCVLFCDHVTVAEESCSEGFMDYSLLTVKAGQIPDTAGSLSARTLAEDEETRWIFWDYEGYTTCSLTEVILSADIRPVAGIRNQYPSIEIWKLMGNDVVKKSSVQLSPANFTTSGVYRFSLSTAISVKEGYYLGIHQPSSERSVVRLFTRNGTNLVGKVQSDHIDDSKIDFFGNNREVDPVTDGFDLLIYPVTVPRNCFWGVLSESTVVSASSSITDISAVTDQTRVFPDIRITCDGIITNWIVGTAATQSSNFPLVQLRHSTMLYTALTLNTDNGILVSTNLYNFSVSVEVKAGDILVITSTADPVYYQQFNGPLNYQIDSDNTCSLTPLDSNDYPLISVVVVKEVSSTADSTTFTLPLPTSTTSTCKPLLPTVSVISSSVSSVSYYTTSITPTVHTVISSSVSSVSYYTTSITQTVHTAANTVSIPPNEASSDLMSTYIKIIMSTSSNQAVTSSPSIVAAASNGMTIPIILGATIGSLLVLLVIASSVVIALLVCVRRKSRRLSDPVLENGVDAHSNPLYSTLEDTKSQNGTLIHLSNQLYGETTEKAEQNKTRHSIHNPVYRPSTNRSAPSELNQDYQVLEESNNTLHEEEPISSQRHYSNVPLMPTVANDSQHEYSNRPTTDGLHRRAQLNLPSTVAANGGSTAVEDTVYSILEELCVPTAEERAQTSGHSEANEASFIYSSQLFIAQNEKTEFFPEDPIYWEPGSDTTDIYQQLSDRKYREIVRQKIQITGRLGSGQFGTVNQGIWYSPNGPVDAAIKTLNGNTSEEEKVKFLQEAAIMGQFHHPNVVKLLGVVTVGEPTMIVLELISGGDLRGYLQRQRPSQGDSTLPALLLSFCHQIASGMKYLSQKCFVHRDLAARNILVTEHRICKIADFGMSRDLQDENYYISRAKKIPIKWTAPEALHFKRYSTASDVWSYGAVLYEIWSLGHKPFESYSNQECMKLIESGYRLPPPPGCPRAVYELMIQCWHPETCGRPTFVVIVNSLSPINTLLAAVNANGSKLGGSLETGHNLYTDLQKVYI